MDQLKEQCERIRMLLDHYYPNQKRYNGIIKQMDDILIDIIESVNKEEEINKKLNFSSLMRRFVDETTHYSSPIIKEFEDLHEMLMRTGEK